ncbi:DNRLRE domain-containing protein [Kitasatospora sp. NPDC058032]|uniref:DNRLRE domain-containing protein n=1 Tax=Kitasatospora sp. NPDC058032 TaxID=3346307 RepID=UPI0036DBA951
MSHPTGTPPRPRAGDGVPAAPASRRRNGVLRNTAVALAVVLAAEAAVVALTSGQSFALGADRPAAPDTARALGAAEAADIASAHLKARLENRRIEVVGERTESTTTWINPDGTTTLDMATGPVRYKDGSGRLQPIDVDLAQQPDGSVKAKGHPLGLKLAGATPAAAASKFKAAGAPAGDRQAPAVPLVSLDNGNGTAMSLSWRGTLPAPKVDGTRARYENALTATDLVIESTRTGFEQFLELKDRTAVGANGTVTMTLDAAGLQARHNADNSVSFLDPKTGEEKGHLPAPVMWDAQVDERSGDHTRTAPVTLKVTQNGNAVDLTLTPDAAFLNDPETRYPVTVDPAVNIGVGFDTFVQEGYGTDVSSQTELKLGNNGSSQVARSFLQFPMAAISGKQVTAAKLNLWEFHSWSCTAKSWEVWDTGTATTATRWTAQPGWNRKWATTTATKGYSSSCAAGWTNTDITSLVQAWAGNGNANNTLGIRATDETDPYGWKKFNSGNAASNTPYLSVTYNTAPAVSTLVSPANAAVTGDSTPTLSAKATDPDGGNIALDFEVWTSAGTAALQSGRTAMAASGSTFTWTPGTALPAGAYKWRSRSWDGTAYSPWSGFRTFTVDTTAPAATAVSSGDFPAGQWAGTPDASGNFTGTFTFTPPSSDVKDIQYRLDGGTWVTVATTGTPVTAALSFKGGRHTVTAHTRDAAGNVSADTSYVFNAGKGAALTSPGAGERPARRTTLAAEGQTTSTGVRYQYRRGETAAWTDIPVANVTTAAGGAVAAWPFAVTGGKPAPLTWNITDTLATDGPVDVRAVFTVGTGTDASEPNTITVDRNGGNAPDAEVGPGRVNTLTGDYTLSATDASAFGLSTGRTFSSRHPENGAAQEGQAAIFGPQWSAGTMAELTSSDWAYVRQTSPTSVSIVDATGHETGFTATTGGGWKPEPGAETLTLTGALTGTFTLKSTNGATTTFAKVDPAATTWQVTTSSTATDNSTTTVVSEKVVTGGKTLARPKFVVAPTTAVANSTCAANPAANGCRVLEYVYADATTATTAALGDVAGQVKQVRLWSNLPGATAATPVAVAEYRYDDMTRLREEWDPRISPALKTAYSYDAAGRVITLTPPGEFAWTFTYGKAGNAATAGEGMLLAASRPSLQQGSADVVNGTAATNLVYDVPLSGANAPYKLGTADVAAWGQTNAPTDATAIFPADAPPASHNGRLLGSGDFAKAGITYTNASGREVNTASAGGVTTTEYDAYGNAVRKLTAENRALALSTSAEGLAKLRALGLDKATTADRAQALSTLTVYSADGERQTDEFGPLHLVTLEHDLAASGASPARPAGDEVPARTHTATAYDEGRPADAAVSNEPTTATIGARVDGYAADADVRTTATAYDWAKGLATQTTEDPAGLKLTKTVAYDAQGRAVKTSLPKSNGTDVGTTVTTYWSATGTGACAGRPEWADLPCSTGPAAAAGDAGANPAEIPTSTTEYDRYGRPAVVRETANGVTRTTTTTTDAAGRTTKVAVTGGTGTAVPDTTTAYDAATGRVVGIANGTATVRTTFDRLGRVIGYDDGAGSVTTTEYDVADRPVKRADSAPSTTTTGYDGYGRPQSLTDSVAGTMTAEYDSEGKLTRQTLPGGYVLTNSYDTQGTLTGKVYTAADGTVVLADYADFTVHGQQAGHALTAGASTESVFGYDASGRLTKAADKSLDGCTTRAYTFDRNSNRTALTTTKEDCDPATVDSTSSTVGSQYDAADRLKGAGYDAFGRTTTHPGGAQFGYYANDLVRTETSGTQRNTWALDAAGRLASRSTETQAGDGTWSTTATSVNHYGCACDSPSWSKAGNGAVARSVTDLGGTLGAITGATDGTVLQLTNLHGDVSVQLPLDPAQALSVRAFDEYGVSLGDPVTGYGWVGGEQRDSSTASGVVLMGSRLYDPSLGRFLQADPVPGGNANAYTYPTDPVNSFDLDGRWSWSKTRYYSWGRLWAHLEAHIGWRGLKYLAQLTFYFNRAYTGKIGRNAHYVYGPIWVGVGLLGPVGTGFALAAGAYSGYVQHMASKAYYNHRCLAIAIGAAGWNSLPFPGVRSWTTSC